MGVVITEMQGSSVVETQAWALRLVIEVTLDAGLELCVWAQWWCWHASFKLCVELRVWDAGLELHVWALRWYWNTSFKLYVELRIWDAGFKRCVWVLKWCWDAGFDLYVLALQWCWDALHEWLWLASRLKHGPCYLVTCLQWFLNSLHSHFNNNSYCYLLIKDIITREKEVIAW